MLVFVFLWMQMCVSLLTSTLVLEWFLIWAILYPDELSTQDCAPYSRVTGMEAGSWWTRSSIGLLAQPKDSVMALKPTSPLGWRKRKRRLSLLSNQNRIFNMEGGGVFLHIPWCLCVTVVDVLGHGVVIKQIFKLPFEIRTESVHQARTWMQNTLWEGGCNITRATAQQQNDVRTSYPTVPLL